jgi:tetratricopeptide (TPR) repeat protein
MNGQKLPAGAYSIHMIPGKDEFTVIFSKNADQFGSFRYDAKQDALRVKTKPTWVKDSQEQLSYDIPVMTANSAQVILHWEKIAVPFTIEVPNQDSLVRSKIDAAIAANPSDWQVPLAVANAYFNDDKMEDALAWADKSIKVKETFQNLRTKANLLLNMGKKQEALTVAEQAITRGKAEGVDTARFEKMVADLKSKM